MIRRTTIRIDHEENDPHVQEILQTLRESGLTTTHLKGMVVTKLRDQ